MQQSLHQLVDVAAKNAPAGTESGVAFVKQAVEAANNAYANVQKAAKQASDIAEAALYLAGPGGRYITGQVLTVDGGMVM